MIEVSHLSKRYGAQLAVDDLSFTVKEGQIYGFLGPNGAGKSTTMNIITGCLAASEGQVRIQGHDIFEEPRKAKACIGYLPEQPPLYPDMSPREYLDFVAEAKGLRGVERKTQTAAVMERTGLGEVANRLIRNLSKGYRQRVGLAQALLGNPPILILDEPTVGLDPKQIMEIRDLIRSLGGEHTVILSSHILSEVSAVCDEVMILSHGRLVACDSTEALSAHFARQGTLELCVRGSEELFRDALAGIGGIKGLSCREEASGDSGSDAELLTYARLELESGADPREAIFYACAGARCPLLELRLVRASLEEVFLELTADEEPTADETDVQAEEAQAVEEAEAGAEKAPEGATEQGEEAKPDVGDL